MGVCMHISSVTCANCEMGNRWEEAWTGLSDPKWKERAEKAEAEVERLQGRVKELSQELADTYLALDDALQGESDGR